MELEVGKPFYRIMKVKVTDLENLGPIIINV